MELLDIQKVSNILEVNPETVRRWTRNGELKSKLNSRKEGNLIDVRDLKRFCYNKGDKYADKIEKYFNDITQKEIAKDLLEDINSTIVNINEIRIYLNEMEECLEETEQKLKKCLQ